MKVLFSIFLRLLILTAIGFMFNYYPGLIKLDWQGYHLETSLTVFACLFTAGSFGLYYLFLLMRLILLFPFTLRRSYRRSRQHDAQYSLAKFFLAEQLADWKSAKKLLKPLKLLHDQPLSSYLQGELAWRLGEKKKAFANAEMLLGDKNAADLSYYQRLRWQEEKGNLMESLEHAQDLLKTYPHSPWLLEKIFSLHLRTQQYNELPAILEQMEHEGILTQTEFKHKRALVFYVQAEKLFDIQQFDLGLYFLERAHTLAPDNVGICLRLIEYAKSHKHIKWMKRTIEETWAHTPHPALFSAYLKLLDDPASSNVIEQTRHLISYAPHHFESYYALIRTYLNAHLWGEARATLKEMTSQWGETPRLCRLWAELEGKEFNNTALQAQWLKRALNAEPEAAWECQNCCASDTAWRPFCPKCNAFDVMTALTTT